MRRALESNIEPRGARSSCRLNTAMISPRVGSGISEHLDTLKSKLEAWIDGRPYRVEIEHESGPEIHVWRFTMADVFEAPAELGLIFGDYIHNLRCALDQLVWALAVNNNRGKEPADANLVGFPIADNPAQFLDAPVLRNLTWEQITVLERFQPYHGGDTHKALADLNSLWNDDKHRLVLPVIVRIRRMPVLELVNIERVESEWFEADKPLKPNTKIVEVRAIPSGSKPDVQVKDIPVQVAFGKRRRVRDDDVPRLRDVTGEILLECKKFFENGA